MKKTYLVPMQEVQTLSVEANLLGMSPDPTNNGIKNIDYDSDTEGPTMMGRVENAWDFDVE